jgi:hypothetical protein
MEFRTDPAAATDALPVPRDGECVLCFVDRALDALGCDTTLRWATRWRQLRAPGVRGLERRLEARGGFCDCEVFLNGWTVREDLLVPDPNGDGDWPPERPECPGVGPRSSQPCSTWVPLQRGW